LFFLLQNERKRGRLEYCVIFYKVNVIYDAGTNKQYLLILQQISNQKLLLTQLLIKNKLYETESNKKTSFDAVCAFGIPYDAAGTERCKG
jgi:hypothetical protein